jgi:hypothetical protein
VDCGARPLGDGFLPDFAGGEGLGVIDTNIRLCADAVYVYQFDCAFRAVAQLLAGSDAFCITDPDVLCSLYRYQKRMAIRFTRAQRETVLQPIFGAGPEGTAPFDDLMSQLTDGLRQRERMRSHSLCDKAVEPVEDEAVATTILNVQAYASHAVSGFDAYVVNEAVTELKDCLEILSKVAADACLNGKRYPSTFGVIAELADIEGGEMAVARLVRAGASARKALIVLADHASSPFDDQALRTLTGHMYGWAAAARDQPDGGAGDDVARTGRTLRDRHPSEKPIYLLPQRLSW